MPLLLVQLVRCFFGRDRASSKANSQDAIDPGAREDRLLHDEFALGAREHPAADGRVFALGVLADDEEVDLAGLAIGERARDAGHQADRAQVDVLVELAAELDQGAPERDVIGHLRRPADGAVEDRVVAGRSAPSSRRGASRRARGNSRSSRTRSGRTRAPRSNRPAAFSRTRRPSGTTSLPMPSPGITAIRNAFIGIPPGMAGPPRASPRAPPRGCHGRRAASRPVHHSRPAAVRRSVRSGAGLAGFPPIVATPQSE